MSQYYERTPPSTFPRVPALRAFAILEAGENVHNAADEEEELLLFKHRTIETSVCLISPHFVVHASCRIAKLQCLTKFSFGTLATVD